MEKQASQSALTTSVGMLMPGAPKHDRMTAWACCNAILRHEGQEEALFGEWHEAIGDARMVDPVAVAHRILGWRARLAA